LQATFAQRLQEGSNCLVSALFEDAVADTGTGQVGQRWEAQQQFCKQRNPVASSQVAA